MFITFEGLDFSGKSTQAQLLAERLRASLPQKKSVHFLREPGGTDISERIRGILLDKANLTMCDLTELLLFSASRAQLVAEVVRPALSRGELVLCDRYCDSTTAYQGYGRGVDLSTIAAINAAATGGTMPDLTFFIDIPVEEIIRRKEKAGVTFDRMESGGREFYRRVRQGYQAIATTEPERFVRIEGTRTVEDIEVEIWDVLKGRGCV